jgi:hypothetical protein
MPLLVLGLGFHLNFDVVVFASFPFIQVNVPLRMRLMKGLIMNFLLWSQFLKSRFLEINDKEIDNVSDVNRTIIKVVENMAKCCVNVNSVKWWLWKDGIQPIVLG